MIIVFYKMICCGWSLRTVLSKSIWSIGSWLSLFVAGIDNWKIYCSLLQLGKNCFPPLFFFFFLAQDPCLNQELLQVLNMLKNFLCFDFFRMHFCCSPSLVPYSSFVPCIELELALKISALQSVCYKRNCGILSINHWVYI